MASLIYRKDDEGISSEDNEEEISVSRRGEGSFNRGIQSSRFGSVDEDSELRTDTSELTQIARVLREQRKSRADVDPLPYQADTVGSNPSTARWSQSVGELDQMVDQLVTVIGFGKFHVLLLFVCGCGLFFASVQLGFVGLLMPDIARDLCLSDASTGWLRGSVFVGVILASIPWGCAADLSSGRISLALCLAITGLATFIAACFSQSQTALLVFLIIASLGSGGVIAIPFAYVLEFLPRQTAQRTACALLVFTVLGAMFVPLLTPAFAPSFSGPDFTIDSFAKWRIFYLLLSLLPVASAILLAAVLPESPYLLLEKRLWAKAIQVLAKVYSYNHGDTGVEMFKDRANGLYRLKRYVGDPQAPSPSTPLQSCMRTLRMGVKNLTSILDQSTFVLSAGAFCFAFGYFAWTLWLTDFITADGRKYNVSVVTKYVTFSDDSIATSLERHIFINTTFDNVSFVDIHFRDVSWIDCSFASCVFVNAVSEATFFTGCLLADTRFLDTDFQPRQFAGGSVLVNSTVALPGAARGGLGCSVDVPFAPAAAYWRIVFGHSGGLLALLLSVLITRVIETWRLFMCGALVTAVTTLFGFFPLTGWTAAAHLFLLQFGGFMAWSALIVQAAVTFPTRKRITGLSLLLAVVTTGGLLGFMTVVALPLVADVIMTATAVLTGALCSYFFTRHPRD